jgi:tricorn protease
LEVPALSLRLALLAFSATLAFAQSPQLLQKPAVSRTHVVFTFAGDLWTVPRAGGEAVRLTTGSGVETDAMISPDGKTVAFSASYDGNVDLFTVALSGGVPKRLTWHPGADFPLAFSADGKQILFRSGRATAMGGAKFFTMSVDGGPATELPSGRLVARRQTAGLHPAGARVRRVEALRRRPHLRNLAGRHSRLAHREDPA